MKLIDNIIKGFSHKLTTEEQQQINEWKAASEENLRMINDLHTIDKVSNELPNYQPVDKDQAWRKVKSQLVTEAPKKDYANAAKILGILLLLAIGSFVVYTQMNNATENTPEHYALESPQSFQLNDGTQVELDKYSSIDVISKRHIALDGRANFNVISTPNKDQFVIDIKNGQVVVVGTQFTINQYDSNFELIVTEGHVQLKMDQRTVDVRGNQIARLIDGDILVSPNTDINNDGWMTNELVFEDEPLDRVLSDLSNYFRVAIVLDKSIPNGNVCLFNTTFQNPTLEEVFQELKTIFKAQIIKQDNSYVIKAIEC